MREADAIDHATALCSRLLLSVGGKKLPQGQVQAVADLIADTAHRTDAIRAAATAQRHTPRAKRRRRGAKTAGRLTRCFAPRGRRRATAVDICCGGGGSSIGLAMAGSA